MSRRTRVAIVGAGIGAEHLAGYLANEERFEPVVICDLDADRAAALAATAPGCRAETRFDAVLDEPAIDLVSICTPPFTHAAMTLQALAAGKHVVCEKPLTGSLDELDRVEAAAAAAGRLVLPVYQYRFGRGLGQLATLIERGQAGRPYVATLETHWNRGPGYYAVPWRGRQATELGGAVVSHAIHAHDLLTQALGPVARVGARLATRVNAIETEDCAAIVLEMANGALATSSITLGAAHDTSRFRFCFEHLTAESGLAPYTPAEEPWSFTAREPEGQAAIDATLAGCPAHAHGFDRLFELVHATLEGGGPPALGLADARRSLELATAIYHAAGTGTLVDLPLAADHPARAGWLPKGA